MSYIKLSLVLQEQFFRNMLLLNSVPAAGLPIQRQSPLSGLQLPSAFCADLLRTAHHPEGIITPPLIITTYVILEVR